MVDYSKAKIYQVLNDVDDDVYIGSTCQSLNMRMVGHRKARTGTQYKNYKFYKTKIHELGVEHFYIELIKETPCENKEQLRAIEGEYIRKYGTLNSQLAGRTREEWHKEHKERKSEQNKINYPKVLDRKKEYRENNPEEYKKQKKKSYEKRKEKILAKNKERIECEICRKELSRDYMRKHIKAIHS